MASFATDIRPLFRAQDVDAMQYAFDLSAYDDVKTNGEAIYERLADGSMPCDAPWPASQLAQFRQWLDEGAPA
jgi:hypothetical protein